MALLVLVATNTIVAGFRGVRVAFRMISFRLMLSFLELASLPGRKDSEKDAHETAASRTDERINETVCTALDS
jgi:hypothetical protein